MAARICVAGTPVPKGSKRGFIHPHTGRVIIADENSKALRRWEDTVRGEAERWRERRGREPFEGPVAVTLTFTLERPASVSAAVRPWPQVKPDVDKLQRAVLDALTGVVYRDDSQVVALASCKRYGSPAGVTIDVDAARPEIRALKIPPTLGELAEAARQPTTQEEPSPC